MQVAEAMEPYLGECFGNPSSGHVYGRRVRADCVPSHRAAPAHTRPATAYHYAGAKKNR